MDESTGDLDWGAVSAAARRLATVDQQIKVLNQIKREARDSLFALVQVEGYEDDKGHQRLDLPEPVEGIRALQIQRRRSRNLDPEVAEEILRAAGLWEECVEYVAVLDEDKVLAAHYEGRLTEEQIDEMYPLSVTEAFVPVKA